MPPAEPHALATPQLDLRPLDAPVLDALVAGDRAALESLTGAAFPRPLEPPPLVEEHLDFFRDRLRRPGTPGAWCFWLMVARGSRAAAGLVGLPGEPDERGRAAIGYSVYPRHEGRGYATEAVRAVLEWALAETAIQAVRATIAPDNAASIRVATKAGMHAVGAGRVEGVGEVIVFERRAGCSPVAGRDRR